MRPVMLTAFVMPVSDSAVRESAKGEFEAAIPILTRGITTSEQVPLLRPPIGVDLGGCACPLRAHRRGLAYIEPAVESAKTMGRIESPGADARQMWRGSPARR
jgi:hypothetical protein